MVTPTAAPEADGETPHALAADPERLAALQALRILDTAPEEAFDGIVAVAAEVCDAPVALVSLVDRNRQWFKARVGFAACETDLDSSVCVHTLGADATLVIPDLAADPRTSHNPLVTGPEALRFYAGAPIRDEAGVSIGALCVIDTAPRPEGLTSKQDVVLRQLAKQVSVQLEMRRLLAQRDDLVSHLRVAHENTAEERRRLTSLFDNAPSFMALQRGPGHTFEMVNSAFADVVGRDVVGRPVREALPEAAEQGFVERLDAVYRTGKPFTANSMSYVSRPDSGAAAQERFLDFLYQPFVEDGAITGVFTVGYDVTARVLQVRRQAALTELGDRLRDLKDVEEIGRAAAQAMAEALDVSRAGIGTVDPEGGTVLIHANWRDAGVSPVEGLFRFADYGSFLADLQDGKTVILEDVETDPRSADQADALRALGIRVLVNIPIVERGRLVLIAFVHFDRLRPMSEDDILFVTQVADRTQAALSRLRQDEQQRALNGELAHRMKNSLAMVQAIANQTLRQAGSMEEARQAIGARLQALSRAQDLLTSATIREADVRDVVAQAMAPHLGDRGQISTGGPPFLLSSQQGLGLSLALHELATNAVKYGALSVPEGHVDVRWRIADGVFRFEWIESGGPPVVAPERRGFGSKLIERIVGSYFDGEVGISFDPEGVRFFLAGTSNASAGEPDV